MRFMIRRIIMNQNELAKAIALIEGKKKSVSIAQVKEIMKIHYKLLNKNFTEDQILRLVDKYGNG